MKIRFLALVATMLCFSGAVHATVTINVELARLTSSNSVTLPGGTLWALISQDSSGNLPGGLLTDGSLYFDNDPQAIMADFSGQTIELGATIGGGRVVGLGGTSSFTPGDVQSSVNFNFNDYSLTVGDKLAVYWFPGQTLASNTLPTGEFEIGAFHRTSANTISGGNSGLVVPTDGANVTAAYLDNDIESGSGIDQKNFEAIAVPEASSLLLLGASLFAFLKRRL